VAGSKKSGPESGTVDIPEENEDSRVMDGGPTVTEARRDRFVEESYGLFKRYYAGTREFRERCRRNEEYWKTNHWHDKRTKPGDPKPTTPMIFSMVDNLHSDIMDQYPEPQILPVEPGDDDLADELSVIVNSILDRRNFRKLYRAETRRCLKRGASCWQVVWDNELYAGIGDVDVLPWDIRYFLWEPGVESIQDGESVIKFGFKKKRYFKERYPDLYPKMRADGWRSQIERYNAEDPNSDDNDEVLLMERWYKRYDPERKRTVVHVARIAGYQMLYWSEEKDATRQAGVYEDGLFPFIVVPLYPLDDTPIGLSVIDIFRDNQDYIDKLDQIVLKNALMAGKLRLLKSPSCSIPLEKLADWGEETLEGAGIGGDNIRWFQAAPLPPMVQHHLLLKIQMMKEESGQNQFNRGEGGKGVTAASAIMALQEAGSKRSRNLISHFYDYFSELVWLMASRIRQFYDEGRVFRIKGNDGNDEIIHYQARRMRYRTDKRGRRRKGEDGTPLMRQMELDVKVRAQKQSPYQSAYLNELALQLRAAGVLDEMELLDMMSFEGKEKVKKMVLDRMNAGETPAPGGSMGLTGLPMPVVEQGMPTSRQSATEGTDPEALKSMLSRVQSMKDAMHTHNQQAIGGEGQ
jgi:hypothetical protein